jgi:hypothetical protein
MNNHPVPHTDPAADAIREVAADRLLAYAAAEARTPAGIVAAADLYAADDGAVIALAERWGLPVGVALDARGDFRRRLAVLAGQVG